MHGEQHHRRLERANGVREPRRHVEPAGGTHLELGVVADGDSQSSAHDLDGDGQRRRVLGELLISVECEPDQTNLLVAVQRPAQNPAVRDRELGGDIFDGNSA